MSDLIAIAIVLALIAVAIIDARQLIIPDSLSLLIAFLGSLDAYFGGTERMWDAGLGAVLAFIMFEGTRRVMSWRLKREAMGFGDVKLMAAGGLWIGAQLLPVAILLACVFALLGSIALAIRDRAFVRDRVMPFGPYLASGLIAAHLIARFQFL